jgi:hypothetical protein
VFPGIGSFAVANIAISTVSTLMDVLGDAPALESAQQEYTDR